MGVVKHFFVMITIHSFVNARDFPHLERPMHLYVFFTMLPHASKILSRVLVADSDKLGDLIVRIVDEFSKASDLELPVTPEQFDTQLLVAHFSNSFTYLVTEVLATPPL